MKKTAQDKNIRNREGFCVKTETSILEEIEHRSWSNGRTQWVVVREIAQDYIDYLKSDKSVKDVTVAGSYRSGKETVGDLDILVTVKRGFDIMAFCRSRGCRPGDLPWQNPLVGDVAHRSAGRSTGRSPG